MNAKKAIELGFADGMLEDEKKEVADLSAYAFSSRAVAQALFNKLVEKTKAETVPAPEPEQEPEKPEGRSVDELKARLTAIKKYM